MVDKILGVYRVRKFKGTIDDLRKLFSDVEYCMLDVSGRNFNAIVEFPVVQDIKEQIKLIKTIDKKFPKSQKTRNVVLMSIIVQKGNVVKTVIGLNNLSKVLLQLLRG